jgi:hypothetical protein
MVCPLSLIFSRFALFAFAVPQLLHFRRSAKQYIELALGFDVTVLEHDDVIGPTQGGATMADCQDGGL